MTRLPPPPWLMLVVDLDQDLPWPGIVAEAIAGGVNMVQVRARRTAWRTFVSRAREIQGIIPQDVPLIINRRADVARIVKADGVHLPEDDLPIRDVRARFPELLVGRSLHSEPPANEDPDYWVFGNVFPTVSHPDRAPKGVEELRRVADISSRPVLAIGGITPENAGDVMRAGAAGVAVISAIALSPDPRRAAEALRKELTGGTS